MRLYDRDREAVWKGYISVSPGAEVMDALVFGGVLDVAKESITNRRGFASTLIFETHVCGSFANDRLIPSKLLLVHVKVGEVLNGNPHKAQAEFDFEVT